VSKRRGVSYTVEPVLLINGTAYPATSWSVDINAYSISSAIDCTLGNGSSRAVSVLPDFGTIMQTVRPLPIEIRLGYTDSSTGANPAQPLTLESGYVDEATRSYTDRTVVFTARGSASLFQDVQITTPVLKNQAGSAIIKSIFQKRAPNVPITIVAPSPQFSGKTPDDQNFVQTMRGRSEWDVMQAISIADGYRLTVHAGKATYGPYGLSDPVLAYAWGKAGVGTGIVELDIKHSPRRSHNIKVIARSYIPKSNRSVSATYGVASASDGETFQVNVEAGLTSTQIKQRAQTAYEDIAKREFLMTATIVPDETFVQIVSANGANFSIQLGGDIWPSHARKYEIRQVHVEYSPGGSVPVLAHIVAGDVNPVQDGAFVS
jgi:hypothetical protein